MGLKAATEAMVLSATAQSTTGACIIILTPSLCERMSTDVANPEASTENTDMTPHWCHSRHSRQPPQRTAERRNRRSHLLLATSTW